MTPGEKNPSASSSSWHGDLCAGRLPVVEAPAATAVAGVDANDDGSAIILKNVKP